jgi:hypothetical protein
MMTQIVKTEVDDAGEFQHRFETSFHSLTLTLGAILWRKNTILPDHGREALNLCRQFGSYRDISKLPALEL